MTTFTAENGVEFVVSNQRGNAKLECRGQYLLFSPVDAPVAAKAIKDALAREDGLELLPQSVGPKLGVKRQKGGIGLKRVYGRADVAYIFLPDDVAGEIANALTKQVGFVWL